MIQVSREPPKCRKCGKTLKWLPWTGKPQPPVDPTTNKPCDCWKTSGESSGDDFISKSGRIFDKADKYKQCSYCSGFYHIDDGNAEHERVYHSDKKIHRGGYVMGEGCWEDEILYKGGSKDHWYLMHPDENGNFLSVDGKENIRDFAKKHGIKKIKDDYLLQ